MNRYLLLILLSSWANVVPLSFQCETGVAYPKHVLGVPRSLMNNADVAYLETYQAETLDKCITDCCAEKYGLCTVASFKKNNFTHGNCRHFNCRPVEKCKFLSSNETDSFSFTSSSSPQIIVPSRHSSTDKSTQSSAVTTYSTTSNPGSKNASSSTNKQGDGITKQTTTSLSDDQLVYKDDNVTVKPRKGVDVNVKETSLEDTNGRSGVKPRKGVNLDVITTPDPLKSKVKPRKGVGPYQSHLSSSSSQSSEVNVESATHGVLSSSTTDYFSKSSVSKTYQNIADDIESALKKVFEDDAKDIKPSTTSSAQSTIVVKGTISTAATTFFPTVVKTVHSTYFKEMMTTPTILQSSLITTNHVASSSTQTPDFISTTSQATNVVNRTTIPSYTNPTILEHSKLLFHEISPADENTESKESVEYEIPLDSESERKYKSSMHLVLSLVFGLLVLFSVLGVVAKRVYDGWMRRHYRRMDFLIDGMYNAYG